MRERGWLASGCTYLGEEGTEMVTEYAEDLVKHEEVRAEGEILGGGERGEGSHESDYLICREVTLRLQLVYHSIWERERERERQERVRGEI